MMRRTSIGLFLLAIAGCSVPLRSDPVATEDCSRTHRAQDLVFELPCEWKNDHSTDRPGMHWYRMAGNTMLLQVGDIARRTTRHDLDSSLVETFGDRRIAGVRSFNKNTSFIHGTKELGHRGDSLYIYLEDTVTWKYYHFDGHFVNGGSREGFINAIRESELVR